MTVPDPRDATTTVVGTRLRDAAVDPAEGDFLAPINAGEEGELGNPHGPTVISPEIHASEGVHPVTPGAVSGTAATQDAAEKAHVVRFQPLGSDALAVTPATAELAPDGTQQLTATVTYVDDSDEVVTGSTEWSSSDEDVATVDAAGLVTAVADGEATITGTYAGASDTCVVTVATP